MVFEDESLLDRMCELNFDFIALGSNEIEREATDDGKHMSANLIRHNLDERISTKTINIIRIL